MPAGSMEDDIFYDLFGEEGLLTPKSTGSTDQDSGLGSPFESSFDDASPQSTFGWDTAGDHGEFWGSILDDLPSDITDDSSDSNPPEQQQLHYNDFKPSQLSTVNDSYSETKVLEESITFVGGDWNLTGNFVGGDWNLTGNVLDTKKQNPLPVSMDYSTAVVTPIRNILLDTADLQSQYEGNDVNKQYEGNDVNKQNEGNDVNKQNEIQIESTPAPNKQNEIQIQSTPAPVVVKAPTFVVKASEMKPHFKVGKNIFSPNAESIFSILSGKIKTCGPTNDVTHSDHDYAEKDTSHITPTATGVSQGMGPGLTLTDEEKRLLDMESLQLPEGVPLTKDEEKVLKKVRRKIKNKQSAMESRRRRKEYIDNLEHRVKYCTDVNNELKRKVDKLSKENKSLVNELKVMKEFIAGSFQQTRAAGTGTCLAILLLSFALFILPFNPLYYFDGKAETIPGESPSPTVAFRSRTLLAIDDNTDYIYQDNEFNNFSSSMSYHNNFYESHNESKINFENIGGTKLKTNIMYQNFTWHSMVNNNTANDHYITS